MIDLIRQYDFFNPLAIKNEVHVIGVGAVGSHVVNALTRMGIENIHIWDFDTVGTHNIPNQAFEEADIGELKINAISKTIQRINSNIEVTKHDKYISQMLSGYVFVCVDSITIRKNIYDMNQYNKKVIAMFDTRIGLDDGQVISANWDNEAEVENLIEMSNFKEEETEVPVSACGSKLTVLPTVSMAANVAVSNFISKIKTGKMKKFISFNAFNFTMRAF